MAGWLEVFSMLSHFGEGVSYGKAQQQLFFAQLLDLLAMISSDSASTFKLLSNHLFHLRVSRDDK